MTINVQRERRRDLKSRTPYHKTPVRKKLPEDRSPATSNGVHQVTSLAKLPTIEKTITIDEKAGEIQLCWRLKAEDVRALKMMLLIYEANGWKVN